MSGTYLAYVDIQPSAADGPPITSLHIVSAAGGQPFLVATDVNADAISLDGSTVAFHRGDSPLFLLNTVSGVVEEPPGSPKCSRASWSPDNSQLACSNGDILVLDIPTGATTQLTSCARDDLPPTCFDPVWSPDGKWIAFTRSWPTSEYPEEGIYLLDTSCLTMPGSCTSAVQGPIGEAGWPYAWTPDGPRLTVNTFDEIRSFDLDTHLWTTLMESPFGYSKMAWSPDGNSLALEDGGDIYLVPALGGPPALLVDGLSASIVGWLVVP